MSSQSNVSDDEASSQGAPAQDIVKDEGNVNVDEIEMEDLAETEEMGASSSRALTKPSLKRRLTKSGCLKLDVDLKVLESVTKDQVVGDKKGKGHFKSGTVDEFDDKVSYIKLKRFIENMHPTKTVQYEGEEPKEVKYHICDELGHLPLCKQQPITSMAKEIGIGPTLFLMSTKALAFFFLLLTIINIPVMLFYSRGNKDSLSGITSNSVFSQISLGNVGDSSKVCSTVNYAQVVNDEFDSNKLDDDRVKTISMECSMGKIGDLISFGLVKDNDVQCQDALNYPEDPDRYLDTKCSSKSASENGNFNDFFPNNIPYPKEGESFSANYYQYYRGASMMDLANVVKYGKDVPDDTNWATLWWSLNCQGKKSCDVPINMYNFQRIETSDGVYKNNPRSNKNSVWNYDTDCGKEIESRVSKSSSFQYATPDTTTFEPTLMLTAECDIGIINPFSGSEEAITKTDFAYIMVIIDMVVVILFLMFISFMEYSQYNYAKQFEEESIEMNDFSLRIKGMPYDHEFDGKDEVLRAYVMHHFSEVIRDQMKLNGELEEEDFDKLQASKGPRAKDWDICDVEFGKSDMFEVNYLNQLAIIRGQFLKNKAKIKQIDDPSSSMYLDKQNEDLQEKWVKIRTQLNEEKQQKKEKANEENTKERTFRFAYVVFRSMDGAEALMDAYKVSWLKYFCIMRLGSVCCSERQAAMRKLHFFKRWPDVRVACDPDNIQWFNLKTKKVERRIRTTIVWIIAIIIVLVSITGIVYFKNVANALKAQFSTKNPCPEVTTKPQARFDQYWITDRKKRFGYMHCYCQQESKKDFLNLPKIQFKNKEGLTTYPCKDWAANFVLERGMVIGVSVLISVINIVSCTIFLLLARVEKKHTINEETTSSFIRILIMQFVNIALVILIVNMQLLERPLFGVFPILDGDYPDFDSNWYSNVGKTITLTMVINIFSPHASKLLLPLLKLLKRFVDRGCSSHILKDPNDQTSIRTKQVLQEDLNDLYTGDQISSEYVYAQNFTYLWVCLMYSTGMPLMYPLACMFYTVLYWVYKFLLLQYYKRTNKFNQELPIFTTNFIKIGVVLHGIFGGLMITNSDLIPSDADDGEKKQGNLSIRGFWRRFQKDEYAKLYIAFWVLVIIWMIAKETILKSIWNCLSSIKKSTEEKQQDLAHSKDFYKEIKAQPLADIYDKANDELEDFENEIQTEEYDEYRFEEEIRFKSESFKQLLQYRVEEIERVIDNHLIYLHGEERMHQFQYEKTVRGVTKRVDVLPEEKLNYLLQLQPFFESNLDYEYPETLRMRMQTITQSYQMLDSALYIKMKPIAEAFEDNDQWNLGEELPDSARVEEKRKSFFKETA